MKCSEAENLIYRYPELDPDKQRAVDNHLQSCDHCRQIFDEWHSELALLQKKMNSPFHPSENLTNRIMRAVEKPPQIQFSWTSAFTIFDYRPAKLSMAIVSAILIVTFVMEVNHVSEVTGFYKAYPAVRTVELNSTSFLEAIRKNEPSPSFSTLTQCLMGCADKNNCDDCKIKYKKLQSSL